MIFFNSNRSNTPPSDLPLLPPHWIHAFLAAWFFGAGVQLLQGWNEPAYLTLEYSGFKGLGLLLGIILAAMALMLHFVKNKRTLVKLASLAFLFFSATLFIRTGDPSLHVGLFLLSLIHLVLTRDLALEGFVRKQASSSAVWTMNLSFSVFLLLKLPIGEILAESTEPLPFDFKLLGILLLVSGLTICLTAIVIYQLMNDPYPAIPKRPGIGATGIITSLANRNPSILPMIALAGLVLGLQSFLVGRILYARYQGLMTPTYDFNLFAQMFYSMRSDLTQMTTLERNMPLSHFAVHISPIYYLMLPVFWLFPDPSTLQIAQAVIVASGIIPVLLICRHFKLTAVFTGLTALLFLFSPAFIVSSFYDLHENCFLVPLILWLVYFAATEKTIPLILATILTLLVKEDAALYVWAVAGFLILDRRKVKQGSLMFFGSAVYFLLAASLLKNSGEGPMTNRFANMIGEPSLSLLSVPLTVLRNPGYVLLEIFTGAKLAYIAIMLLPLGIMPFFIRRYSVMVLAVPFFIMNLISDYPYQADIRFQYNYGSAALLFCMMLLFLKDRANDRRPGRSPSKGTGRFDLPRALLSFVLAVAVVASVFITAYYLKLYEVFPRRYQAEKSQTDSMKAAMAAIPRDASVLASPYLTGFLSDRRVLYDTEYNFTDPDYFPADYVVLDLRPDDLDINPALIQRIRADGYRLITEVPGLLQVYTKPSP